MVVGRGPEACGLWPGHGDAGRRRGRGVCGEACGCCAMSFSPDITSRISLSMYRQPSYSDPYLCTKILSNIFALSGGVCCLAAIIGEFYLPLIESS
jgi:hypothetical protein